MWQAECMEIWVPAGVWLAAYFASGSRIKMHNLASPWGVQSLSVVQALSFCSAAVELQSNLRKVQDHIDPRLGCNSTAALQTLKPCTTLSDCTPQVDTRLYILILLADARWAARMNCSSHKFSDVQYSRCDLMYRSPIGNGIQKTKVIKLAFTGQSRFAVLWCPETMYHCASRNNCKSLLGKTQMWFQERSPADACTMHGSSCHYWQSYSVQSAIST